MSQPTPYTPASSFAEDESNGVGGRSTVRTAALDAELAAIETTLGETLANLKLIQRDDGKLRDGIVKTHTLSTEVRALLAVGGVAAENLRGAWVTATAYVKLDVVVQSTNTYICTTAHTSGTFATDLTAGKWILLSLGSGVAASSVAFTPTTTLAATTVQAAIEEADTENRVLGTNLASSDSAKGTSLVTHLATGTGAVGRDLRSRLNKTILATDFNVDPTGVADSTAGLQAFFTAVAGKRGRIPEGTYLITQGLVIQANTHIEGDGDATVIKASASYVGINGGSYATQTCQMIRNQNFSASSLTDSDITISGITFDWGSVTIAGGGAHCIALRYVDRVNVLNCRSIGGENLTALMACRDTLTWGCRVKDASNAGLDHWAASGNCQVAFCTVRNPGSNSQQGIMFTGTGSYFEDLSATDCLVMGCTISGVRSAGGTASAILSNSNDPGSSSYRFRAIGNLIDDCDMGLVFSGTGGQHVSVGDTLRGVTKLPIFVQNDGTAAPGSCRVIDAHLIDCSHLSVNVAMISLSGSANVVKGLKVTNTGAAAYEKIAWLTSSSSSCILEIETAATGTVGRVQNDGSGNVVVDQALYSDVAALESAWTTYTPAISATSGSFTTVAGSGRYKQIGKMVWFNATATITTNGTAAGSLLIALPVTAKAANAIFGVGRDSISGTLCLWANSSTSNAYVQTTAGVYPGADGRSISISGTYEAA